MSTRRIHFNRHIHPRRRQQQPEPEQRVGSSDICPRCGGALRPTTGIHRILDPRLVCSSCGYLWTPDEAIAGSWRRGDREPEPPGAGGYLLLLVVHWVLGFILLAFLGLQWYVAERAGWCSSSWDYQSIQDCISGKATEDALLIFRTIVPALLLAWLTIGTALIRRREGGCITAPASGLLLLVSFCLILYLS